MHISDEDLVSYLLGNAAPELVSAIESAMSVDEEVVERVTHLRFVLGQVDTLYETFEPPSDLVESTLERIEQEGDLELSGHPKSVEDAPQLVSMKPAVEARPGRRSFWDTTVLALSLSLLCCMVLPAIVRARFESRKAQCADNLRTVGAELVNFALNSPDQRFPYVSPSGPTSFAGVYAVHLQSAGFAISPPQLRCSSLVGCEEVAPPVKIEAIPNFATLSEIAASELQYWQQAIGGDYAYNLGVTENAQIVAPKYEGRTHFAIMADAPVFSERREELVAHDGYGINLLFEDGRVMFVSAPMLPDVSHPAVLDHPFRNLKGVHAVGLSEQDTVLGPSHHSPLGEL